MTRALIEVGMEPSPLRWSTERYLALVESRVIEEGRGVELIDGQVIVAVSQGKTHHLVRRNLLRALAALGAIERGLDVQPTIVLPDDNVFDPEFAFMREGYDGTNLPTEIDIQWVIEVSVSSRRIDLGPKKSAYAAAKISIYWVVDVREEGIWIFAQPENGIYQQTTFIPAGEAIEVPLLGARLETRDVFPGDING